MNWIRRQASHSSGRSTAVLLSSVLALLALACFPILAQAAGSGSIEYDPALPGDGGPKQNENIAKSSQSPNSGGAEAPPSAGSGDSSPEEVAPSSEGESTAKSGNEGGTAQRNPDKGSNPPAKAKVQPATPIAKSAPIPSSSSSDDDDGSSPLVPILIGVFVLAAISLAAIVIRQRRHRDAASPLSTKAG